MQYQVTIGRDQDAGVWLIRSTDLPGLSLEDASLDSLLEKLPQAVAWLLQARKVDAKEVPIEVVLVEHQRVRLDA
jgi:hypothetical protein